MMEQYNSILKDIQIALREIDIPIETSLFSKKTPDQYLVLTPLNDAFDLFADNLPQYETHAARISLFTKHNYLLLKETIIRKLIDHDFLITERRYIDYEEDTGYHHFVIDVEKQYEFK